jgi:ABC-type transport system involved in cytochrome bd biosynthesis fused ATPase/permease subunit
MLETIKKTLKRFLLQITFSVFFIILFLASFYNFYIDEKINIPMLFFVFLIFAMVVVVFIDYLTQTLSKSLVKQFKETIKNNIEKNLVVQTGGHRLSQLELNNIGAEAIKGLEPIIKKPLTNLLYYFSLGLIFTFILTIFMLFHEPPLDDIIQYLFHGDCKPVSVQK